MKSVPLKEINQILSEVMNLAVKNGANSISMPDEYVAVAHFLCYPEEYCLPEKELVEVDKWDPDVVASLAKTVQESLNEHTIACRAVGGGTGDDYCICPKG